MKDEEPWTLQGRSVTQADHSLNAQRSLSFAPAKLRNQPVSLLCRFLTGLFVKGRNPCIRSIHVRTVSSVSSG